MRCHICMTVHVPNRDHCGLQAPELLTFRMPTSRSGSALAPAMPIRGEHRDSAKKRNRPVECHTSSGVCTSRTPASRSAPASAPSAHTDASPVLRASAAAAREPPPPPPPPPWLCIAAKRASTAWTPLREVKAMCEKDSSCAKAASSSCTGRGQQAEGEVFRPALREARAMCEKKAYTTCAALSSCGNNSLKGFSQLSGFVIYWE